MCAKLSMKTTMVVNLSGRQMVAGPPPPPSVDIQDVLKDPYS